MEIMLLNMMNYTRREWERFMALGGDNGDPNLMTKPFLICYENAYPLIAQNMPDVNDSDRQMLYQFMSQGAGRILTWWIKDGMQQDPEHVISLIMKPCVAAANTLQ